MCRKKPSDAARAEHLIYLARERLVIMRLHIRVNGRHYATVWQELIDKYFTELDTNKDGTLDAKEQRAIPSVSDLQNAGIIAGGQPFGGVRLTSRGVRLPTVSRNSADTDPKDGKVTPKELRAYLLRAGVSPFSVTSNANTNQRFVTSFGRSNPADAGKKLFDLLDTNSDGKLSKSELTRARKSVRKADLDDDDLLSLAELSGPSSPFVYSVARGMNRVYSGSAFLSLSGGQSKTQTIRQLIRRYDKPQPGGKLPDGKLSAAELGFAPKTVAAYDADKNGALDVTELKRFLEKPAAGIEMVLRLGKRKYGQKTIEVLRVAPGQKSLLKKVTGPLAHIAVKYARIDFGASTANREWSVSTQSYDQQFKSADRNNNGYLEKSEARIYGSFNRVFDLMDADKDGKVFLKEVRTFFRRQLNLAQSRTLLSINDQGRDLFKILDLDRDQRLSRSELQAAVSRIDSWDDDGDKQIAKSEVPRQYRLGITRGRPGNSFGAPVAFVAYGGARRGPRTRTNGPKWFGRMDINGDGEVSRREFLGKPSAFKRLDTDRNGWLSPEEAGAAGAGGSTKK